MAVVVRGSGADGGGDNDGVVLAGVDGAPAAQVALEILGEGVRGGDGVGGAGGGDFHGSYPGRRGVVGAYGTHVGLVHRVGRETRQDVAGASGTHEGHGTHVGARTVSHLEVVAIARPGQRGGGGMYLGDMQVVGLGTGGARDAHIVHGRRWVGAGIGICHPQEEHDIVARIGEDHVGFEMLPAVDHVLALAAVGGYPSCGRGVGKGRGGGAAVGQGGAGDDIGAARGKEDTHVVVVGPVVGSLTVGAPVVGHMVSAALQGKEFGGVGHAAGIVVVGVAHTAVVGNVDGTAAAIDHGGTPVPFVGAVAVNHIPGTGAFEVLGEGVRLVDHHRQAGRGEGGHAAPGAIDASVADGTHIDMVIRIAGQAREGDGGVGGGEGGHLVGVVARAVGHGVLRVGGTPGDGGCRGMDVAGRHVGGTAAVGTLYRDVVDAGRGHGTHTVVLNPHEHQLVVACHGDVGLGGIGLPCRYEVLLAGAVEGYPAVGNGGGVGVGAAIAAVGQQVGREGGRGRSQEDAQVVVVALTVGAPVVADVVHARTHREKFAGIHHRPLRDVVAVGVSAVGGDVEAVGAAVAGGGAVGPAVGASAVLQVPGEIAFEGLEVRVQRVYRHGGGRRDGQVQRVGARAAVQVEVVVGERARLEVERVVPCVGVHGRDAVVVVGAVVDGQVQRHDEGTPAVDRQGVVGVVGVLVIGHAVAPGVFVAGLHILVAVLRGAGQDGEVQRVGAGAAVGVGVVVDVRAAHGVDGVVPDVAARLGDG